MSHLPVWLQLIPTVLTVVIAAVVAWIGVLQYRIARRKVIIDVFEHRFKNFEELILIAKEAFDPTKEDKSLLPGRLFRSMQKTRFLFGLEVFQLVDCFHTQLIKYQGGNSRAAADLSNFEGRLIEIVQPYLAMRQRA